MEPSVFCSNSASVEDEIFKENHITDMIMTFPGTHPGKLWAFAYTVMDFSKGF